jgi:hypothetical protein
VWEGVAGAEGWEKMRVGHWKRYEWWREVTQTKLIMIMMLIIIEKSNPPSEGCAIIIRKEDSFSLFSNFWGYNLSLFEKIKTAPDISLG